LESNFELQEITYVERMIEKEESSRYLTFSGGTTGKEKVQDYSIKTLGVAREKKFQAALETDLAVH
jgi:nucleoid-associated protein YejK